MGLFWPKIPRFWVRDARNFHVCFDDPNKMDLRGRAWAQLQIFHIFRTEHTLPHHVRPNAGL